jgi:hypothetical protein
MGAGGPLAASEVRMEIARRNKVEVSGGGTATMAFRPR